MEIDKLQLSKGVKIFALIIYILHFYLYNLGYDVFFKNSISFKSDLELKDKLLSQKSCLIIIGGSNAKVGLSAEIMSKKSCNAINLGVDYEAYSFENYFNWFNNQIAVEKVIYSPAFIWSSSISNKKITNDFFVKIPDISIFSIVKSLFHEDEKIFNRFGDKSIYKCLPTKGSFKIITEDFINSNIEITHAILKRVLMLKYLYGDNIFIRIPPIYVESNRSENYKQLISERINLLKDLGVNVINSTVVSTDKNLFCESIHPNARGREIFTNEISLQ